jgi:peptidoglycan/LPS O-acetylase OafA/YrhL
MKKKVSEKKHGVKSYDNALGIIKVIAIICIVLMHYGEWSGMYSSAFFFTGFFVTLFVVGSGFGITLLYLKYHSKFRKLLKHQCFKIYTGLVVGTLSVIIGVLLKGGYHNVKDFFTQPLIVAIGGYVEELRFLFNFILSKLGSGFIISAFPNTNGSLWFISLVVVLYLLFPLLYTVLKKWNSRVVLVVLLGLGIASIFVFDYYHKSLMYNLFYFTFGIFFAINYEKIRERLSKKGAQMFIYLSTVIVFAAAYFVSVFEYVVILFLFLSLYILFDREFFGNLKWVSKSSVVVFIVFIIHQPYIGIFSSLLWRGNFSFWENVLVFLVYSVIVLAIAVFVTRVYKKLLSYYNDY